MQSEGVKARFGRCPYCRAMIYQDPNAVIFYCSKCRTPIRGKNPKPTDETEYALSQLEILSADTASVFSDDVEPSDPRPAGRVNEDDDNLPSSVPSWSTPYRNFNQGRSSTRGGSLPYRQFGSVRTGPRGNRDDDRMEDGGNKGGSPLRGRVAELRPSSRRTRRSMSGDADVSNNGGSGTDSESDVPAAVPYRRRASPLSSQELDASTVVDMSALDPAFITRSALSDPAFQKDLLQALDNLRKLIAAVDQPRGSTDGQGQWHGTNMSRTSAAPSSDESGVSALTVTRRDSRLMRRLESQLVQALPREPDRLPRDRSTSSSSSSASSSRLRARAHRCRPVLGGTPFVLCNGCSEILQLPGELPTGRAARLQCGSCGEALTLTLPAGGSATARPKKFFSAPQPAVRGGADEEAEERPPPSGSRRGSLSSEHLLPAEAGPLHRVLGYSTVSSVLRSRRYGDEHD